MERVLVIIPSTQALEDELGFEHFAWKFYRSFGDFGDEFHAAYVHLTRSKHRGLRTWREGNIEVRKLGLGTGLGPVDFFTSLLFQLLYLPWRLRRNRCILVASPPHTGLGATLLRRVNRRARLYVRVMGDSIDVMRLGGSSKLAVFLYSRIGRFVLRSADLVVAISNFTKEIATRAGASEQRIVVVPSPVADYPPVIDRYKVEQLQKKFGSRKIVLCVARMRREKGIEHLIKAWAMLLANHPDARLVLVGEGGLREELEQERSRLNLDSKVFFEGWIEHKEIFNYYHAAAVIAVPSLSEGLGMVAVEAGLCRRPVVASNVGGLGEVVRDGWNGFLVPPGDENALAGKIAALLSDDRLRERFGHNGYEMAQAHLAEREGALIEVKRRILALVGQEEETAPGFD